MIRNIGWVLALGLGLSAGAGAGEKSEWKVLRDDGYEQAAVGGIQTSTSDARVRMFELMQMNHVYGYEMAEHPERVGYRVTVYIHVCGELSVRRRYEFVRGLSGRLLVEREATGEALLSSDPDISLAARYACGDPKVRVVQKKTNPKDNIALSCSIEKEEQRLSFVLNERAKTVNDSGAHFSPSEVKFTHYGKTNFAGRINRYTGDLYLTAHSDSSAPTLHGACRVEAERKF